MTITCFVLDHDLSFVFRTKVEDRPATTYRCRRGCGLVTIEDGSRRSPWGVMVGAVEALLRRLP